MGRFFVRMFHSGGKTAAVNMARRLSGEIARKAGETMALRESGEDYLEAILMLHREHGVVRSVDIAEHLGVTKASVSKAMSMLEERGYVEMAKRDVRLTEKGLARAEHVLEQHVFFRDLLVASGVEPGVAAEEACHMEHCLSDDSFGKLKAHVEHLER